MIFLPTPEWGGIIIINLFVQNRKSAEKSSNFPKVVLLLTGGTALQT